MSEGSYRVFTDASFQECQPVNAVGLGAVLIGPDGQEVATVAKRGEAVTCTEAECLAARLGLELAREHGAAEVEVLVDCTGVLHHLTGDPEFQRLVTTLERVSIQKATRQQVQPAHVLASHSRKGLTPALPAPALPAQTMKRRCPRCRTRHSASPGEMQETGGYCRSCVAWFARWESML